MELSTVIFIGLLVCVVKDVHAGGEHGPLERRLSLIENDMNAWKGTVVDIERKMFDKFKGLESSLKENLTGTFVPSLIKRLLKQSIADILDEDCIGNIISARVIDQVDSMKVNIQNTKTRLKAITQQLRRVEHERNTYRDHLVKDLTVTRRDIRALEQNVKQLNTCCVMRTETVPGSTTAPTDPSLSTTVPPVTTHDSHQHASTDPSQHPSLSTTVPPVTVTTQDSDQHATPSAATGEDLYDASERGDLETVRRIVAAGRVDVNYRGGWYSRTPVMMAARSGHRDVVEFLVGEGADLSLVDKNGNNILHLACDGGDLETVKLILSLDVADINSRGWWSRTPVMKAAVGGHRDVLEFLVGEGADPSLVDSTGDNALHLACRGGHLETVKLIVSLDVVDVNSRGDYNTTPVMQAAGRGHRDVLEFLVGEGADTSLVDGGGNNVLHLACVEVGDLEIVKLILSQNAVDINARDSYGYTAAGLARRGGLQRVVDLLVSRGGTL